MKSEQTVRIQLEELEKILTTEAHHLFTNMEFWQMKGIKRTLEWVLKEDGED